MDFCLFFLSNSFPLDAPQVSINGFIMAGGRFHLSLGQKRVLFGQPRTPLQSPHSALHR